MRSLVHPPLILIKSWWQIQNFLDRMAIAGNGEANLLLPPANEVLGQGNVFTPVCHSVGGWLASQLASQVT